MSAPKKAIVLSAEAKADINDILLYTWQQWGEEQRDRYAAMLDQAIAALSDFAEVGVRMPRLFHGCRARPVERHVIYYRIVEHTVEVVRILHERNDPTRHIQR